MSGEAGGGRYYPDSACEEEQMMADYRPFHAPGCPARDPAVNVDRLRIDESRDDWPANMITERICTCPPERFGAGSHPIWEPRDEPVASACPVCGLDDRRRLILRMALNQLGYSTDTGAEKALIAEMLAALAAPEPGAA